TPSAATCSSTSSSSAGPSASGAPAPPDAQPLRFWAPPWTGQPHKLDLLDHICREYSCGRERHVGRALARDVRRALSAVGLTRSSRSSLLPPRRLPCPAGSRPSCSP